MLSPSWFICLLEAPDGNICRFLVRSCHRSLRDLKNWEGLHTLNKKKKEKETDQ